MIDSKTKYQSEREVLHRYHDQIFQMVNSRLTETFKFYPPLLIALSGLGYSWLKTIEHDLDPVEFPYLIYKFYDVLDAAIFISVILFGAGACHILATSYTYRSLRVVLSRIEKELELDRFAPHWNPCEKIIRKSRFRLIAEAWIVPEVLKPQFYAHLLVIVAIGLGYCLYFGHSILFVSVVTILSILMVYFFNFLCVRKVVRHCTTINLQN